VLGHDAGAPVRPTAAWNYNTAFSLRWPLTGLPATAAGRIPKYRGYLMPVILNVFVIYAVSMMTEYGNLEHPSEDENFLIDSKIYADS